MASGASKIGYAAMLEQFGPQEIVDFSVAAERAGMSGIMAADHFQPWVPEQGNAPFVWNVMTLLAEKTKGDIGPGVTCPGWRMHPATVAQASATLAAMYPGRHWLGLGSGEALNEHVVGGYWPEVGERIGRMFEAIEISSTAFLWNTGRSSVGRPIISAMTVTGNGNSSSRTRSAEPRSRNSATWRSTTGRTISASQVSIALRVNACWISAR